MWLWFGYFLQDLQLTDSVNHSVFFAADIIQYDRGEIATRWWKEADEEVQRDFGQDFFKMNMRRKNNILLIIITIWRS